MSNGLECWGDLRVRLSRTIGTYDGSEIRVTEQQDMMALVRLEVWESQSYLRSKDSRLTVKLKSDELAHL